MTQTLSNGFVVMEQDDSAELFYRAYNQNMILMNQIAGRGSGGSQTAATLIQTIQSSDWTGPSDKGYSADVTWTNDLIANNAVFNLYLLPSNDRIFLDFNIAAPPENKKITVYTNDNTISVKIHAISL